MDPLFSVTNAESYPALTLVTMHLETLTCLPLKVAATAQMPPTKVCGSLPSMKNRHENTDAVPVA